MKLTVSYPVSDRSVEEKEIPTWVNQEARRVLQQGRAALNLTYRARGEAETAGTGAYTRIWTSPVLPTSGCWDLTARIAAVSISGAAQRASYHLIRTYESTAGTCAAVGAASTAHSAESAAAIDARFGVDTTNRVVYVEGRDDGTSPMRFVAVVELNEAM